MDNEQLPVEVLLLDLVNNQRSLNTLEAELKMRKAENWELSSFKNHPNMSVYMKRGSVFFLEDYKRLSSTKKYELEYKQRERDQMMKQVQLLSQQVSSQK
eukprot:TRINITY_DN4927_c0_g1_i1.p1 TRINITY_DN4927_c0_g1~~TRINITY_DN4927_c0_g1_i1.p1  ORF type:complete len:100 (+),score=19.22 TRINITY_DN4927_c0_g1_i1:42-341(+)